MDERTVRLCGSEECTGCRACFNACRKGAISFEEDPEGFLHPRIDHVSCVHCRACVKACPVLRRPERSKRLSTDTVRAAVSTSSGIAAASSSGGLFTELARAILNRGGVVFGATWKSGFDGVEHTGIESEHDLDRLRGSKYVQSDIGSCYTEAARLLRQGRTVLFSGTPCQIAGLYGFLGGESANLYTVDIVCHGVPSPRLFADYKAWLEKKYQSPLRSFSFRDKKWSWHRYNIKAEFEGSRMTYFGKWENDAYIRGFLRNLFLRTSCHTCPFAGTTRFSDITLSDFWGYSPEQAGPNALPNNDKGISMVMLNTEQGAALFRECSHIRQCEVHRDLAVRCNSALNAPIPAPSLRADFWSDYRMHGFEFAASRYCRPEPMSWEARLLYLCGAQSRLLMLFRQFKRVVQRVRGSLLYRYHKYFGS